MSTNAYPIGNGAMADAPAKTGSGGQQRVMRGGQASNLRGLPLSFLDRLATDSDGGSDYRSIQSIKELDTRPANSSYCGTAIASFFCCVTTLVRDGELGLLREDADFELLAPGYHRYVCCGTELAGTMDLTVVNQAMSNGTVGFVTVAEGNVGVLIVGSSYRLLAPGTYEWSSPRVRFEGVQSIQAGTVRLGPYTLVTVPTGQVAVTFYNGELRVLGYESGAVAVGRRPDDDVPQRTFFLDDPKWELKGFLPTVMQTDRLEGNDLLSKDNVEVLMVAMAQWRIVDPVRAVNNCAATMEEIRVKVNQLVRATIARIVAGTCIGAGPVSGSVARPVVRGVAVAAAAAATDGEPAVGGGGNDDADLAHLMQSEQATKHMAELTLQMDTMGIEVAGVYVPEKRMKNDDIRSEVAKQAVIGIKAEAERAAADATAYATVKAARAQAEAVGLLANAHAEAGRQLGAPEGTAARLALSETLAKSMEGAKVTVFTGAPEKLPFMLTAPTS